MGKTAMEELIEKLEAHIEDYKMEKYLGQHSEGVVTGIRVALAYAKSLLPKEREQIIGARIDGALNDMSLNPRANSEDYFTQKYGNR